MNNNESKIPDTPGVLAPPPLIYSAVLAVGLLAHTLYPVTFLPNKVARTLGWPLIDAGLVLGFLGDRAMRNAHTNVSPYRPTTKLVTEGPYRFTRNPLYLKPHAGVRRGRDPSQRAVGRPSTARRSWRDALWGDRARGALPRAKVRRGVPEVQVTSQALDLKAFVLPRMLLL